MSITSVTTFHCDGCGVAAVAPVVGWLVGAIYTPPEQDFHLCPECRRRLGRPFAARLSDGRIP